MIEYAIGSDVFSLAFFAFLALVVTICVHIGFRTARAFQAANARINADVEFMRAIPTGMDWDTE